MKTKYASEHTTCYNNQLRKVDLSTIHVLIFITSHW